MPRVPDLRPILRTRAFAWGVAAAAALLAILFAFLWRSEASEGERSDEVRATAAAFLQSLTNFSAETIDRDVAAIRAYAVGRFADEVDETFSQERIEAIRAQQATSRGEVRSVFVQELGEDTATVFGVVDESVTNAQTSEPREDTLRIELGMIETADAWKVERVELLQTPAEASPPA